MYTAAARVRYEYDTQPCDEHILLSHITSFTDAMKKIEDLYGNDLLEVRQLELFDGPVIIASAQAYADFVSGKWEPCNADDDT